MDLISIFQLEKARSHFKNHFKKAKYFGMLEYYIAAGKVIKWS